MTVRLRPHHLLCLLTYVGKGYSPAFIANYDRIAARLSRGEGILLVDGPDDICAPLLEDPDAHCRRESVIERDRRAAGDLGRLLGLVEAGTRIELQPETLSRMRAAFAEGLVRGACRECEWCKLCGLIAGNDYSEVRVRRQAPAEETEAACRACSR